ncbi:MAG: DUF1566 domain-containing protein [Sulfurimonadaceae bacterium]|jgi:hypothetical protein
MFFKTFFLLLFSCSLYSSEIVWNSASTSDVSDGEYQQVLEDYVAQNYPKEFQAWEGQVKKEINEKTFRTGNLMWQDDADAKTVQKNWYDAQAYCNNLQLVGFNDWRLPTMRELQDLYGKKSSLKNTASDYYWNATPYVDYKNYAWVVDFNVGGVSNYYKYYHYFVRCVRGGQ